MTARRATLAIVAAFALGLLAAWVALPSRTGPPGAPAVEPLAVEYYCPMHPTIVRDRPGDCPICGMRLVPRTPGEHAAHLAGEAGAAAGPQPPSGPEVPGQAPVTLSEQKRQLIRRAALTRTGARAIIGVAGRGRPIPVMASVDRQDFQERK